MNLPWTLKLLNADGVLLKLLPEKARIQFSADFENNSCLRKRARLFLVRAFIILILKIPGALF
jgi:hypothetical protein